MLCGSCPARIDDKSRLKIPSKLKQDLPETEDDTYFITSDNGKCAQIYPMPVWERLHQKLMEPPRYEPAKVKLQRITSYYGITAQLDSQGRLLIPPEIREDAQIAGDVMVIARTDHLEIWNKEAIRKEITGAPLTLADRERLAELGF